MKKKDKALLTAVALAAVADAKKIFEAHIRQINAELRVNARQINLLAEKNAKLKKQRLIFTQQIKTLSVYEEKKEAK